MAAPWGLFVVLVFFTPTVHSSGGDTVLYNSVTGCSSQVRLNPGNIIDIRASVSRGAELLLGGWESSLSNCVASCCHMARCDLVLFKNVGLSQSGRNCYFIHCGSSDNCVTVSHEGFTSASITPSEGKLLNWAFHMTMVSMVSFVACQFLSCTFLKLYRQTLASFPPPPPCLGTRLRQTPFITPTTEKVLEMFCVRYFKCSNAKETA